MAKNSKVFQVVFVHYPFTAVRLARLTTRADALGHKVFEKSYRMDKKRIGRFAGLMGNFNRELPLAGLIFWQDPEKMELGEADDGKGD